ncbi:MAG TPA: histidine phosphatase family protein [Acetobacteraceae bacterium]|nr:histidine phosphatase family protein [Acetobacteraceae bacterium]
MAATTFHLIRHATYELLDRGILAGRTPGWGLNEAGRAQAAALGRLLAGTRLTALIASPMERAQETAAAIGDGCGVAIETDPAFDEVDFGDWSNLPFTVVRDDPRWPAFNRLRSLCAPPGGETMLDVQRRAVAAVRRLAERYPGGEIAIVTHGDVVKALLVHVLGMALDLFHRLDIAPASRSTIVLGADYARVIAINLPPD